VARSQKADPSRASLMHPKPVWLQHLSHISRFKRPSCHGAPSDIESSETAYSKGGDPSNQRASDFFVVLFACEREWTVQNAERLRP
jgi:hypothetical protein